MSCRTRIGSRALVLALAMAWAAPVHSEVEPRWVSLGVLTGATAFDPSLADYQWDTRMQAAFGAEALVGVGRWSGGLRAWRTQTTQGINAPGVDASPVVRSTSVEAVGRVRLARVLGFTLEGSASAGRRHLGFSPDEVSIDTGLGAATEVRLAPIDEWTASAGASLGRRFASVWSLGLQIEQGVFALDTAHRQGSGIETGRESFGEWNARVALARRFQER